MKRKHYYLVGAAVVLALIPAIAPSFLSIAFIGALLGIGAVYWSMRDVDAEVRRVQDEIVKVKAERDSAVTHAKELDRFFTDNGYAELTENRQRIEVENADFERQIEAKRLEFEQEMERQCSEYEHDLAERNARQEQVLQEKTALEMTLKKEANCKCNDAGV